MPKGGILPFLQHQIYSKTQNISSFSTKTAQHPNCEKKSLHHYSHIPPEIIRLATNPRIDFCAKIDTSYFKNLAQYSKFRYFYSYFSFQLRFSSISPFHPMRVKKKTKTNCYHKKNKLFRLPLWIAPILLESHKSPHRIDNRLLTSITIIPIQIQYHGSITANVKKKKKKHKLPNSKLSGILT